MINYISELLFLLTNHQTCPFLLTVLSWGWSQLYGTSACLLSFALLPHSPFTAVLFLRVQLLKLFPLRTEDKMPVISRFRNPNQFQAVVPSHPTPPKPALPVPMGAAEVRRPVCLPGTAFHRITEWWGLEGTSVGHPVQPPAQAGSPTVGCRGPCPGRS